MNDVRRTKQSLINSHVMVPIFPNAVIGGFNKLLQGRCNACRNDEIGRGGLLEYAPDSLHIIRCPTPVTLDRKITEAQANILSACCLGNRTHDLASNES